MSEFSLLMNDFNLDLIYGEVDGYPKSVTIDYDNNILNFNDTTNAIAKR